MKSVLQQWLPPIAWNALKATKRYLNKPGTGYAIKNSAQNVGAAHQDLDLYWDENFADALDAWGEGTAWHEITFLLANCEGNVLDIACGTGKVLEILKDYSHLQLYGCDISDMLIKRAVNRGIAQERLKVCDATQTDYPDNFFDYAYSIGSLEHFTENGIIEFVAECHRITKRKSFHMIPVSRSNQDEGWITPTQSYFNNSIEWWLGKFHTSYETVYTLDSLWQDKLSLGKWFVCEK